MNDAEAAPQVIGLLTDFGLVDPYVGQMKAVLASLAPHARVIDISHHVAPHDPLQGAFFLVASLRWFPKGAIILAVVDPGVGTARRIVLLDKDGRKILAPDNGILSQAIALPGPARAWDLTPSAETPPVKTFHGRDVFAPLAAKLLSGDDPSKFGPEISPASLTSIAGTLPERENGCVKARILHVDRFGNAVLNLDIGSWRGVMANAVAIAMAKPCENELVFAGTYADLPPDAVGVLAGSQGYMELAVNQNSAAKQLGLAVGDPVVLLLKAL